MIYLDSSVPLELYLDGPRATEARAILDQPISRVTSWLLAIEVPLVLRRELAQHPEPLRAALERFDRDLEDIGLVDSLVDVAIRIRSDPRFSRCRALDAIHAGTALLLREWTGHDVRIETFDRRLGELADALHLR